MPYSERIKNVVKSTIKSPFSAATGIMTLSISILLLMIIAELMIEVVFEVKIPYFETIAVTIGFVNLLTGAFCAIYLLFDLAKEY
jgi:hypothetical protein